MTSRTIYKLAFISAIGLTIATTQAATITLHGNGTITTDSSGAGDVANLDTIGSVGNNGPNSRIFYQVSAYNVSTLMSDVGISDLAELANYSFTYEGITTSGSTLTSGTYLVHYVGTYSTDVPSSGLYNLNTPGNKIGEAGQWTDYQQAGEDIYDGLTKSSIDTSITDISGSQTITGSFNLSSLATDLAGDGDLSDNYVMFAFSFSDTATGINQGFDSVSLTSQAVPEPSSTALIGLAGIGLILRRNRKA